DRANAGCGQGHSRGGSTATRCAAVFRIARNLAGIGMAFRLRTVCKRREAGPQEKRHCYAATDAIVVDVRSGNHLQGDQSKSSAAPSLQTKLIGTSPIAWVVIVKDSKTADTLPAGQTEFEKTWTDPQPSEG